VRVPVSAVLGEAQRGWAGFSRALERALPLLCSYMVGGCQAVYDKSVLYTQTRVQFGVPIGRFQRVQDHVVKLVNHLDSARWTTWEALWKLDTGPAGHRERPYGEGRGERRPISEACNAAHEVHAGMGVLVRVRPARPHPDVADAVPLPRRPALAQAADGRRARVVAALTIWWR
jgi:alkylation response protein AidB-like acyl-CoA dehydrogenase